MPAKRNLKNKDVKQENSKTIEDDSIKSLVDNHSPSECHSSSGGVRKRKMRAGKQTAKVLTSIVADSLNGKRFTRADFDKPSEELCKYLLGKLLVSHFSGYRVCGRIVEAEAYPGGEDMGSCTFNGRRTERMEALYMPPGTAYVYMTYGMYSCMNISSRGDGAAVLIRGLEPLEGLEVMKTQRAKKLKSIDKLKDRDLCNGPSKLTMALNITKNNSDRMDLVTSDMLYIEPGENIDDSEIISCSRIGLSNAAGAWKNKPLRFYIRNRPGVSVVNEKAELASAIQLNK